MVVEELIAKLVVAKGLVSAEALDSLRTLRDAGDGRPLEVLLVEERLIGHDTLQQVLEEVWGQADVGSAASDSWDMTQVSTRASDAPSAKGADDLEIGQVITLRSDLPLLVRAVLGRGGMGVVYLVMDPALRRLCALKLTLAEGTVKNRSGRFQRETVVTAGLDHPGIPAVFEAGATASGRSFLLMQYLPGRSLKDRLGAVWRRGAPADCVPLSTLRPFLQNLVRVCEAVAYAHSRGVVHRDLKPANVMLGQFGEVCVVDWGLARDRSQSLDEDVRQRANMSGTDVDRVGTGEALTQDGAVLGSAGYMAPEQARGDDVDSRADVFSLGAVLSVILTGYPPFSARGTKECFAQAQDGLVESPGERRSDLPPELCAVAAKALAPEREDRYRSAEALGSDLEAFLEGRPVSVYRYGAWEQSWRMVRRHPAPFVGLAAVFAVALVGILAVGNARDRAERAAVEHARNGAVSASEKQRALPVDAAVAERLTLALEGLGTAQRWHTLSPRDPEAARRRFDAALDLGSVASGSEQWALADQAFGEAELLAVDDARARELRQQAAEQATAKERKRREAVRAVLDAARSGALARSPGGVTNAVFGLVRYPHEETVSQLSECVSQVTARLQEVRAEVESSAVGTLAVRQREEVGQGSLDAARVCCEALGWIGRGEACVKVLGDYMDAEADVGRAAYAGEALCRIGGESALALARRALVRFNNEGLFTTRVGRALRLRPERAPLRDESYGGYMERALMRQHEGDLRGALADYVEAIALQPDSWRAWSNLASIRDGLGDRFGAIADYSKSIAINPDQFSTWASRAAVRLMNGDPKGAATDCDRALELEPTATLAWNNRGIARRDLGQLKLALSDFARAVKLDPDYVEAYSNRGTVYQALGNYDAAIDDYSLALRLDDESAGSLNNRGLCWMRKGEFGRAFDDLRRAVELRPDVTAHWVNRGTIRRETKDVAGAVADAKRALQIDPEAGRAWKLLGLAHRDQGKLAEAISDLTRAVELEGEDAETWESRGVARGMAGDPGGAIADLTRSIEIDPKRPSAWTARSAGRQRVSDVRGAIDDLTVALTLTPNNPVLWSNRGATKQQGNDIRGAASDYRKAIELDAHFPAAHSGLASVLMQLNDLRGALAASDRAVELAPQSHRAWMGRAMVRRQTGDAKGALFDLDRALVLGPKPPKASAIVMRGIVRAGLGDRDGARADLERALTLDPPPAIAAIARTELAKLDE